ncbi:hypothetical protein [Limnoglobus roseus]|uniref:3'-5' exonuclease n=1 Tax=Limnoglobus roseus TaxID=2598579 RepID=A0A5C1AIL3_9BACT|nr:hypothetical protein [Limnoglobus roseus]QEL17846.1 hypothetical protein PX52LOC_04857 [Limnoglobus roseus]
MDTVKNILIDEEFTGLDNTFIQDNEIVQLKLMDADTGDGIRIDFRATKPVSLFHRLHCGLEGEYPGEASFTAAAFETALAKIGVTPESERRYFGYGVSSDTAMLRKYRVKIEIVDLQELIRLNPEYEQQMAVGGSSMEVAYLLLTGKRPPLDTHFGLGELDLIREIYRKVMAFTGCNTLLSVMPYGHCAGMPIDEYVAGYRRAADGYRFNNSDLLAKSLTARIPARVFYHDDEDDFDDDWGDDDDD